MTCLGWHTLSSKCLASSPISPDSKAGTHSWHLEVTQGTVLRSPFKTPFRQTRGCWDKIGQSPVCLCPQLHPVSHLYIIFKKKKSLK